MFQVGDFYELFFGDAELGAREMEIALTSSAISERSWSWLKMRATSQVLVRADATTSSARGTSIPFSLPTNTVVEPPPGSPTV
ncbi:MAG: hypothetical protein ACNA7Z_07235 [Dethiobacteria bacterium]